MNAFSSVVSIWPAGFRVSGSTSRFDSLAISRAYLRGHARQAQNSRPVGFRQRARLTAEFTNLDAGGEQAYFWRRVFYDIRKVQRMVQNDFPAVLLDLVHQGHGEHLRQFIRTGHLPGPDQPRWIGTFGQSADTPLGFVIRELVRLEVITDGAVLPYAFYVCRPVFRALAKIGWLSDGDYGFSGKQWLARLAEDPVHDRLLKPFHDIPLVPTMGDAHVEKIRQHAARPAFLCCWWHE